MTPRVLLAAWWCCCRGSMAWRRRGALALALLTCAPAASADIQCDETCATCSGPEAYDCDSCDSKTPVKALGWVSKGQWRNSEYCMECTTETSGTTRRSIGCGAGQWCVSQQCTACHSSCQTCDGVGKDDCQSCDPKGALPHHYSGKIIVAGIDLQPGDYCVQCMEDNHCPSGLNHGDACRRCLRPHASALAARRRESQHGDAMPPTPPPPNCPTAQP